MNTKINNVSHLEADAFLMNYEYYDYTISFDEFDELDNDGPGRYYGVIVSDEQANIYIDVIAKLKLSGIDPLSELGLAERLRASGKRENNSYRELVALAIERRQVDEQRETENIQFNRITSGYFNIGADSYSGEWWGLNKRADLPVLFSCKDHRLLQLPNGDIMQIHKGVTWSRWTLDQEIIDDYLRRKAISGWQYSKELVLLICAAEKTGLSNVGLFSYLGGTAMIDGFAQSGFIHNYTGGHAETGPEKILSAIKFFTGINPNTDEDKAIIAEILEKLIPGSITEIYLAE
ncbi:hypothetical protein ACQE3E_23230 (plasmid) [Methylomonas sp. MED-D]|uniref:hypothetical protein n=1 Tax=Methylomonas sp. MED-D TaxID=3418768 RepID=UPI003CFCA39D